MMLTTGILMFGKMCVGVRTIASVPKRKIKIPSTTIVYGCFRASLTIHIVFLASDRRGCSPDAIFGSGLELWEVVQKTNLNEYRSEISRETQKRSVQRIG